MSIRVCACTHTHTHTPVDTWEAGLCKLTRGSLKLQGAGACGPGLPNCTRARFPWCLLCASHLPCSSHNITCGACSVPLGSRLSLWAGMGNKVARSREEKDGKEDKERKEIKAGVPLTSKPLPSRSFRGPILGPEGFTWDSQSGIGNSLPSPLPFLLF